jgi:bisphosphoglycerate-independent phosphoglycerate mutase (AlkP superfamily)
MVNSPSVMTYDLEPAGMSAKGGDGQGNQRHSDWEILVNCGPITLTRYVGHTGFMAPTIPERWKGG